MMMIMTMRVKTNRKRFFFFFDNVWKWAIINLIGKKFYEKQKKRYSKEKAAEHYLQNKEAVKEKARERYKNLS